MAERWGTAADGRVVAVCSQFIGVVPHGGRDRRPARGPAVAALPKFPHSVPSMAGTRSPYPVCADELEALTHG